MGLKIWEMFFPFSNSTEFSGIFVQKKKCFMLLLFSVVHRVTPATFWCRSTLTKCSTSTDWTWWRNTRTRFSALYHRELLFLNFFSWVVVIYCSLDFVVVVSLVILAMVLYFLLLFPLLFCLAPSQWKTALTFRSRNLTSGTRKSLLRNDVICIYSILFSKTTSQQIFFCCCFFFCFHYLIFLQRHWEFE